MKEISEYIVLQSSTTQTFTRSYGGSHTVVKSIGDLITEKIKEGFQPYGFMHVSGEAQYIEFYQPMVKYKD